MSSAFNWYNFVCVYLCSCCWYFIFISSQNTVCIHAFYHFLQAAAAAIQNQYNTMCNNHFSSVHYVYIVSCNAARLRIIIYFSFNKLWLRNYVSKLFACIAIHTHTHHKITLLNLCVCVCVHCAYFFTLFLSHSNRLLFVLCLNCLHSMHNNHMKYFTHWSQTNDDPIAIWYTVHT